MNTLTASFKRVVLLMCLIAAGCPTLLADEEGSELLCEVEVNSSRINNANKDIFNTLQEAIKEYMNETKWTDAQFGVNEKIQCKLFLNVATYDDATGKITGELQIQSQRPVYNSTYTTTLINFKDNKIDFVYQEGEPLVFSEQDMQSNLTAILNFYAYMIIAIDFDTFAPNGGDPYYERAANVVRLAQSTGETGWKAFEDTKNRAAVLSAILVMVCTGILLCSLFILSSILKRSGRTARRISNSPMQFKSVTLRHRFGFERNAFEHFFQTFLHSEAKRKKCQALSHHFTVISSYSLVPSPIFSPCSRVSFHLILGLLSRK